MGAPGWRPGRLRGRFVSRTDWMRCGSWRRISVAGRSRSWLVLLVGLFALTFCSAFMFHRTHKAFFPEAADDRFTHFLITLLSPVTTIRARDALTRPLLEEFHPLAVAKVFCAEAIFSRFARHALLDL